MTRTTTASLAYVATQVRWLPAPIHSFTDHPSFEQASFFPVVLFRVLQDRHRDGFGTILLEHIGILGSPGREGRG
jgi:hypothetical protein